LPYFILENIPFINSARCPSRGIVFVYLFWAVITALSLRYLLGKVRPPRMRAFVAAAIFILIFADFAFFCDTKAPVALPKCYSMIKEQGDSFGILDLPEVVTADHRYMLYQTFHGIPIAGGLISRKLNKTFVDDLPADMGTLKNLLIAKKIKFVVVHHRLYFRAGIASSGGPEKYRESVEKLKPVIINFVGKLKKAFKLIYIDEREMVFRVY
ncbi:MAG: hypothetical protein HQL28_02875, partial [Candidatus Omnitrophica bacterium]|nr:hypothetical protein [Candidatus Omnitrophota bacterium]